MEQQRQRLGAQDRRRVVSEHCKFLEMERGHSKGLRLSSVHRGRGLAAMTWSWSFIVSLKLVGRRDTREPSVAWNLGSLACVPRPLF